jgi:hypothetical protein
MCGFAQDLARKLHKKSGLIDEPLTFEETG